MSRSILALIESLPLRTRSPCTLLDAGSSRCLRLCSTCSISRPVWSSAGPSSRCLSKSIDPKPVGIHMYLWSSLRGCPSSCCEWHQTKTPFWFLHCRIECLPCSRPFGTWWFRCRFQGCRSRTDTWGFWWTSWSRVQVWGNWTWTWRSDEKLSFDGKPFCKGWREWFRGWRECCKCCKCKALQIWRWTWCCFFCWDIAFSTVG